MKGTPSLSHFVYHSSQTIRSRNRLSHRFLSLAGDSQLWKAAYYNRFVLPRASRIPGIRDQEVLATSLLYSSRASKWLEDRHLTEREAHTDWKRQYKLRHNWARGSCSISQIEINSCPSNPPILVRSCGDVVVTVDNSHGIRAWTLKGTHRQLSTLSTDFQSRISSRAPTSLALENAEKSSGDITIAIGFSDGSFATYTLHRNERHINAQYTHPPSSNGSITAIALARPHLITMTKAQLLSLYNFDSLEKAPSSSPHLLASLKSHTTWPPISLSLKSSAGIITASIAYAFPTYLTGWSVGIQELRLDPEGALIASRLASSQGFVPLHLTGSSSPEPASQARGPNGSIENDGASSATRPTSLSYSHPYLLASHTDNTLTLYLVSSKDSELTISSGNRLWGHTSSVSSAQVGDRGKAVSVSSYGDEIRLWELEGTIAPKAFRKRAIASQPSVQVRPENRYGSANQPHEIGNRTNNKCMTYTRGFDSNYALARTKGWVGFDHESIVVLREKEQGCQHLVLYDFAS